MKSEIINGDLFSTDCEVIAHQVNCMGKMNSGVAKTVKEKYSEVFDEYKISVNKLNNKCLGGCLLVRSNDERYIANIFGQYLYNGCEIDKFSLNAYEKPGYSPSIDSEDSFSTYTRRFTNYEAFYRGLIQLRMHMSKLSLKSVAFPYNIGSDRGGASWNIIRRMIDDVFESTGIIVKIYKLN